MDALMIYHTAICQDARRSGGNHRSMKPVREMSAFERGVRRSIRRIVAPFGSDAGQPGPKDSTAIK
tara:strand:+ start:1360 stop:1557 length:198 start_codon:yes stop_codon:yes gene_type:complete